MAKPVFNLYCLCWLGRWGYTLRIYALYIIKKTRAFRRAWKSIWKPLQMYVSCAIISTVQSTSANQIDVPASSKDKSKARQSPTPAGVFLFNSFFIYSLWSLFCQCGNIKKQLVKITVIFIPELCKMVRHKLISCNFLIVNILHLATELYCGKVFLYGCDMWRSFLLLGLRECSALLGEDYERCKCWVTALPFLRYFKKCDIVTQLHCLWDRCGGRI